MGWQRFVGTQNGYVSFTKERCQHGALFHNRPGHLGSLQIVGNIRQQIQLHVFKIYFTAGVSKNKSGEEI